MMNRKQKIIVSITGIILVSLILIGLTYAYFLTKITGNTNQKSISVSTANLILEYADINDELISDSAVEPGKNWTKTFVATNKGNKAVTYGVALENIVNTLERKDDLVYTLDCKQYSKTGFSIDKTNKTVTGTISGTCNGVSDEATFPSIGTIIAQNEIADDKAQVYTLLVTYKEMNEDQSVDMNKTFSAKANIVDPNVFKPYGEGTLATAIIDSAKNKTNGTELLETPKTLPAEATSSFIYLKGEDPTSFTSSISNATNYYISYADDYTVDETTARFTLVNPTIATSKYTTSMASSLVGKYAVWSTSTPTISNTQNQRSISKISTDVSDITSTIKYASIASNTITTAKSTEKELSATIDDYGTSYYYRGGVEDNYVNFAGMCWRIVRIEGDGSTKLILEDQDSTCATSNGNWNIPTTTGGTINTGNFGYTVYAAKTLTASDGTKNSSEKDLMNYLNGRKNNDKAMATAFKNFQTGPLASYLDKLKAGDWCLNDKAYASETDNTTPLTSQEILDKQVNGTDFYYDSNVRLHGKTSKEPTLKCNGTNMNKFSDNTDMYVGTLTADEIVYAGGKVYTSNPGYYLINDYQKSNKLLFWSFSPYYFGRSYDSALCVYNTGVISDGRVDGSYSFRPAIQLKSSVLISGGDGTKANAYTIAD